jgi:hypothetical protein
MVDKMESGLKPVDVNEIYWAKNEVIRLSGVWFRLCIQNDTYRALQVKRDILQLKKDIKEKYEIIL